jgi:hypothetical protein
VYFGILVADEMTLQLMLPMQTCNSSKIVLAFAAQTLDATGDGAEAALDPLTRSLPTCYRLPGWLRPSPLLVLLLLLLLLLLLQA